MSDHIRPPKLTWMLNIEWCSYYKHILQSYHSTCAHSLLQPCHTPLKYRRPLKKGDHRKPTYLRGCWICECCAFWNPGLIAESVQSQDWVGDGFRQRSAMLGMMCCQGWSITRLYFCLLTYPILPLIVQTNAVWCFLSKLWAAVMQHFGCICDKRDPFLKAHIDSHLNVTSISALKLRNSDPPNIFLKLVYPISHIVSSDTLHSIYFYTGCQLGSHLWS